MINELLKRVGKPKEIKRSQEAFWNDPYISKQMLKAHLNLDIDAASRNHKTIEKSVKWIDENMKKNSKILDLGCGPGLYATKLAEKGHTIVGIDLSANSIEYAKKINKVNGYNISYINKNYLEIDYLQEFDAVLLIYRDFSALLESERDKLLELVYDSLKPGGKLFFDVSNKNEVNEKQFTKSWSVQKDGFWSGQEHLVLEDTHYYQEENIILKQYIIIEENNVAEYQVVDKLYSVDEITRLLKEYKQVQFYSDMCGKEIFDKTEVLACIVTKS